MSDKTYKPVVNNRASICTWELEFSFLEKAQVTRFIKKLMKDEINFDFEYYYDTNSENRQAHFVVIKGSWANNLQRISEMLTKVDYQD